MGVDTIAHRMLFHGVDYREASAYNYSHTPLRHQYGGKQEPCPTFALLLPDLLRVNHGNLGRTLWQALFYAVSAYNNTGFTPDASGLHVNRWGAGLPIPVSAFIGTPGSPVVLNVVQCTSRHLGPKRWTLHTKLTLATTAFLVLSSLIWFVLVEWNNAVLFPTDDPNMKLRRAISAAVMPRSAGFDVSWVPDVSNETKVFMSALMFIGAGSSSTGGGIRVTTFAVVVLICGAAFTGHRDVNVFRRRIPRRIQMTAVSVTTSCFVLVVIGSTALMFVTGCSFVDAVFETCSVFALGGYSAGVASAGNPACLFILAAAMIVGRGFRNHHRQPVGCRHLRPVGQIGLSEARPHSAAHWRPPYHQCGNRCRQARGSSGGWQLSGLHRNRRPIQRRKDSHPAVRGGSQHRGCAGA